MHGDGEPVQQALCMAAEKENPGLHGLLPRAIPGSISFFRTVSVGNTGKEENHV